MPTPNSTYINRYIQEGENASLSIGNFTESMLLSNADKTHIIRVPFDDFFIKHMDEFNVAIQLYQIPDTMFYKPKLLSLELYGTTELWSGILRLNKMKNITEFHKPVIMVWEPTTLKELIDVFFKREGKR